MNPPPAAARKVAALIDRLVELEDSEAFDDLAVPKLVREAQVLMRSDPLGARIVLGGVAGLQGDPEAVREHYQAALRLSARDSEVLKNYATALTKVGYMDDAFEAISEACERHPDDPSYLRDAIKIAMQGARFDEGRDMYERWMRLKPKDPGDDAPAVIASAEAISRGAFCEQAARQAVAVAHEIRRGARTRYSGSGPAPVYGEPDRFGFDIHVRALPKAAADLNEALADRIVADDELMRGLAMNFVPTFIGTRTNGGDTPSTT